MSKYKSTNRHKFLLQYHLINKKISNDIKILSQEICCRHNIIIKYIETDKDHIHYMIEIGPTLHISKIVNLIKSYTTYHIWKKYDRYLSKHLWKEKTFWTDGYFISTIGVSKKVLKEYIENQG